MLQDKSRAVIEWKSLLGGKWVFKVRGKDMECIVPADQKEVVAALAIARRYNVPLYPVSGGMNWGYGGFIPTKKGSVILDLSRLNRIISFESNLGVVCVEPGVTMGQLANFLSEQKAKFISPHTGVGPLASIIGNLLEKGRSSSAYVDRLSSLIGLKVLLADGSMYESPSSFFKWGVGPYVDGLFIQSNLGIVLEATVALAPKPISTKKFFISIRKDASLQQVINAVRECQYVLGSVFVSISIQNKERISRRSHAMRTNKDNYNDWVLIGSLGGETIMVAAAERFIKKQFNSLAHKKIFFTEKKLNLIEALNKYIFFSWRPLLVQRLQPLFRATFENAEGKGEDGLEFLRREGVDCSGLLFVPIVLPICGEIVSTFTAEVEVLCRKYSIPFEVSYLNFTPTSLLLSFLVVFDPNDSDAKNKAHQFYKDVVSIAKSLGALLYRGAADTMPSVYNSEQRFWSLVQDIKKTVDPQDLISPGRYIPPLH